MHKTKTIELIWSRKREDRNRKKTKRCRCFIQHFEAIHLLFSLYWLQPMWPTIQSLLLIFVCCMHIGYTKTNCDVISMQSKLYDSMVVCRHISNLHKIKIFNFLNQIYFSVREMWVVILNQSHRIGYIWLHWKKMFDMCFWKSVSKCHHSSKRRHFQDI